MEEVTFQVNMMLFSHLNLESHHHHHLSHRTGRKRIEEHTDHLSDSCQMGYYRRSPEPPPLQTVCQNPALVNQA